MRLIDADELIYESIDSSDTARNEYYYGTGIVAIRKEDIDDAPTIVEFEGDINKVIVKGEEYHKIVRCKDCKYRQDDTIFHKLYCDGREVVADWYCGDAKRRSDDSV